MKHCVKMSLDKQSQDSWWASAIDAIDTHTLDFLYRSGIVVLPWRIPGESKRTSVSPVGRIASA